MTTKYETCVICHETSPPPPTKETIIGKPCNHVIFHESCFIEWSEHQKHQKHQTQLKTCQTCMYCAKPIMYARSYGWTETFVKIFSLMFVVFYSFLVGIVMSPANYNYLNLMVMTICFLFFSNVILAPVISTRLSLCDIYVSNFYYRLMILISLLTWTICMMIECTPKGNPFKPVVVGCNVSGLVSDVSKFFNSLHLAQQFHRFTNINQLQQFIYGHFTYF